MKMDSGARGWLFKTAKKNFWRVAGFCEWDDLIQEGYMCWWRCKRNYPMSRPHQIMGSFKIAFMNEISRMASKRSEASWLQYPGELPETGSDSGAAMMELLAHITQSIPRLVSQLKQNKGMEAPYLRRSDGTRERTDQRIARLLDIPENSVEIPFIQAAVRS